MEKLNKLLRTTFGPPIGKQMVFFVDDVNMPQLDRFGSQPPIELLRQVIDQGGYYELSKINFYNVVHTSFITACAPPGGGRNEVTERFFRHFNMIWLPELSDANMKTIF